MAAVSCFVGLHFGHVLVHCKVYNFRGNMLVCISFQYWRKWNVHTNLASAAESFIENAIMAASLDNVDNLWVLTSIIG
jgi:hypothetical protein